jgi:hypothetical protein
MLPFLIVTVMMMALLAGAAVLLVLRGRGLDSCLLTYIRESPRRTPPAAGAAVHVLLCVADHYEPMHGGVGAEQSAERVATWVEQYPKRFARFCDSDGRPPQHTFFFPIDEYDAGHVDAIAGLCHEGFGEVEIHHHHDRDTGAALRERLERFKELFRERHGLLSVDKRSGEVRYGFVHGNWALDKSRPDGCWCGVNNELEILRQTGCYADFTMPSAPSRTQTRKINSLYYAVDDPRRPKSHDWGINVGMAAPPDCALMLVQGPLLLNWRHRRHGILPHVENGNLQRNQPPSMARLDLWLRARVQAPSRPDWFFVKLYTHGAPESNQAVVLGEPMIRFHEALAERAAANANFHYHYVTAREMYNLAKAAEAGWEGSVNAARDFDLISLINRKAMVLA